MASAAARLLRAYAIQVEALRRLRNGGSQTVRVEHVHVNEGGQALIGNVNSIPRIWPIDSIRTDGWFQLSPDGQSAARRPESSDAPLFSAPRVTSTLRVRNKVVDVGLYGPSPRLRRPLVYRPADQRAARSAKLRPLVVLETWLRGGHGNGHGASTIHTLSQSYRHTRQAHISTVSGGAERCWLNLREARVQGGDVSCWPPVWGAWRRPRGLKASRRLGC